MKKIAFVTASVNRGGASKVISILANYFANREWQVDFLIKESIINGYKLDSRIRIVEFGKENNNHSLKFLFSLRKYLKKERPDVMVSFLTIINFYSILASIGTKTKLVISERNDPKYSENKLIFMMSKLLYGLADYIVFQSNRVRNYYSTRIKRKSKIILNPVEVVCERSVNENKIIATAGRFVTQKNHKMLIKAFYEVKKKYNEYLLYIYGDGPLRCEYESLIYELGLQDSVIMPGNIINLHEKIKDSSMFVISSDYEGLSNSLLEAMLMGIACISTKSGGAEEVLDTSSGILIDVGEERQLSDAIIFYIENPEIKKRYQMVAQNNAQKFKRENVIEEWRREIEKLSNQVH